MQTIHLQGIGSQEAKPAGELKIGDRVMWNYGFVYTVTAITKQTAKTVWTKMRNEKGDEYGRKFLKSRLVAIA